VYQVYIRSFADGDGDGVGDIEGIRRRLPYLRDLGVDALWITPWYPSPMADGGYDVADYRAIDPLFGSLDDADGLLRDAHSLGLRVLIDLVPNHTSERHPWFQAALRDGRGSAARARYHFVEGRGPHGDEPPNNWPSVFGGPAWARVAEPDGTPGQWYLHVFAPEQPDLNWSNPEVEAEFESILAFWLDRGVDGFRIDVAHALVKEDGLPDLGPEHAAEAGVPPGRHPHWDRPEVHEIHRAWRRIVDRYDGDRILMGEVGVHDQPRLAEYLRPDELHAAFNFPYMGAPWNAAALRAVITETLDAHRTVGATPTWVLANHDATRAVTRLGRPRSGIRRRELDDIQPTDLELGTRRARAAILLTLALPGCAYLYQGEELGLWEVEDLPEELLQDPIWERTGHLVRGRDGCRVPLPWAGETAPFDFGPAGSTAWLPQPPAWRGFTAAAEARDPGSMLSLYRAALRLRREHQGFASDTCRWLPSPAGTLLFARAEGARCAVNLSNAPMRLPTGRRHLLGSVELYGDDLPVDAAAWFEMG
jgi:alpha-glucosidase